MAVHRDNPDLPLVLRPLLRAEPRPDGDRPHGAEDTLQHRYRESKVTLPLVHKNFP